MTDADIDRRSSIIRQRVDASGVAEAEITSQGSGAQSNIVVGLPGTPSQETLRPGARAGADGLPTGAPDRRSRRRDPARPPPRASAPLLTRRASTGSPRTCSTQFAALDCTDQKNLTGTGSQTADPTKPLVTCETDGSKKYILGPVEVDGKDIASASSGLDVTPDRTLTNEWVVSLSLDSVGKAAFLTSSQRLYDIGHPNGVAATPTPDRSRFAVVLDGLVIIAPTVNSPITNGEAKISGNFTQGLGRDTRPPAQLRCAAAHLRRCRASRRSPRRSAPSSS